MTRIGSVTISIELSDGLAPWQAVRVTEDGKTDIGFFVIAGKSLDGERVRYRRNQTGPSSYDYTGARFA